MPTPEGLKPEIKDNHDGSICVQYHPTVQGRHEVQMCFEGASVDGKWAMYLYLILSSPLGCFRASQRPFFGQCRLRSDGTKRVCAY